MQSDLRALQNAGRLAGIEIEHNRCRNIYVRLSAKQDQLQQMFTSMELALQKTKSQGTDLLNSLGVNNSSNS